MTVSPGTLVDIVYPQTSGGALRRRFVALVVAAAACAVQGLSSHAMAADPTSQPTTAPAQVSDAPDSGPLVTVTDPNVLIISIDGCRPDCLLRADIPAIRSLMARGSFSLWARTTDIAITLPSHVSMLSGVTPEKHGIFFNADPPDDAKIAVPTLFDLAKQAGLTTGIASGKRKFTMFTRTHHVDWASIASDPVTTDAPVGKWAEQIVKEHHPRLMFVHFPGADVAGHGIGWGTPQQIDAISAIDKAIAGVLHAYDEAGMTDSTYVILSADHGGTARTHGKDDVHSRYIPWIFAGPGVRANYDLTRLGKAYEVATYDTFATACLILHLQPPSNIDGKAILPAFENYDLLSGPPATPATMPAK